MAASCCSMESEMERAASSRALCISSVAESALSTCNAEISPMYFKNQPCFDATQGIGFICVYTMSLNAAIAAGRVASERRMLQTCHQPAWHEEEVCLMCPNCADDCVCINHHV